MVTNRGKGQIPLNIRIFIHSSIHPYIHSFIHLYTMPTHTCFPTALHTIAIAGDLQTEEYLCPDEEKGYSARDFVIIESRRAGN